MEGDVKGVAIQTKPAPADLFCIYMSAVMLQHIIEIYIR